LKRFQSLAGNLRSRVKPKPGFDDNEPLPWLRPKLDISTLSEFHAEDEGLCEVFQARLGCLEDLLVAPSAVEDHWRANPAFKSLALKNSAAGKLRFHVFLR